ncbi:hypothetical protein JG687_00017626, partial [Phytophthora cactorum]
SFGHASSPSGTTNSYGHPCYRERGRSVLSRWLIFTQCSMVVVEAFLTILSFRL